MRKVCPQCDGVFETQFLCPHCGVGLLDPEQVATVAARGPEVEESTPEMATRLVAGLILAQGLYYGLRLIGTAAQLAGDESMPFLTSGELFAHPALMIISVLAGSLVAGAANPRALAAGAGMGLIHAMALILTDFVLGHRPSNLVLFAGWLVLTLMGAIGGRIGRLIWPPLSDIPPPASNEQRDATPAAPPEPSPPIAWARVVGGVALSVGCTVWAGSIRDFVIGASGGNLVVESRFQSQFITWVISALAMTTGGVFASASTLSGVKHGFLVGMLSCVGIFVIHSQVIRETLPAEKFFAMMLDLPETDNPTPARLGAFLLTHALLLGLFGGWFGASLLPKVAKGQSKPDRGSV